MSTTVTAALLRRVGGPLELEEIRLDDPLAGEVLVRVERVGLCHSDLHYVTGSLATDLPTVLGHEVTGVVRQIGPGVTRLQPGDRVVATVTPACGSCGQCLSGRPTQCLRTDALRARPRPKHTAADGTAIGALGGIGAFAEAILVGEAQLAVVDQSMPPEVACLLGCCVTTGIGAVLHGSDLGPGDTVAVIGCGGVGISAVQGARLAGARRIVAVDALPGKLEAAKRFGATDTVLAGGAPGGTVAAVHEIVPGGVDHAIEAVGRAATAELAFALLAPTGQATILGLMPDGTELTLPADALVYGDRSIRGAYMGANRFLSDITTFADHYRGGRLDLDAMVSRVVPFTDINAGLAHMADPDTVRVVVDLTR